MFKCLIDLPLNTTSVLLPLESKHKKLSYNGLIQVRLFPGYQCHCSLIDKWVVWITYNAIYSFSTNVYRSPHCIPFQDDDVEDSDSTVKSKSSILSTAPPEKRLLATCSSAVEQVHAKFDKRRYECRTVHVDGEELKVSQPQVDSTSTVGHIITTRDVLSGVYEGGLKVWECSLDLVRFLASHPSISGKSRPAIHAKSLDGAALVEAHASAARLIKSPTINVLELGCGHGLPGIFMLKKIPNSKVCFQDLNEEVLRYTTARNVIFNAGREVVETRTSFVRGDWTSVHFISKLLEIGKCQSFDIILAAETLYTKDSSEIMSQLLWRLLTPK